MNNITVYILVVDDEETARTFFPKRIQRLSNNNYNFEIDTAKDGEEALLKFKEKHYHIVILDIEMPKKNGIEFLNELRKYWESVKVILYTQYSDNSDYLQKALNLNSDGIIPKSLSVKEQDELLEKLLFKTIKSLFEISSDIADLYKKSGIELDFDEDDE